MPVRSFNQLGPPDLVTPLTINDPNPSLTSIWVPDDPTYGPTGLDPGKDYILMGVGRRNRGIQITGGRNIACYNFDCVLGADNTMCLFTGVQGIVHVQNSFWDPNAHEGDLFKTSGNSDNTIIQIKGALCKTKLLGSTDPGHVHADFNQTSGGFKECWYEDCTFHTAFDGMMHQREANCETMTGADFFPVTLLSKSGNIATARCPSHNFVVGEAVGIWGASTSGWNGGWTVLSVSGSGTTKQITFQLGDTLPANLGTGAGTVAQIVRFAWGYKDGKIRINRVNAYGESSGTGLPPTSALQMIRFGARAAPVPNSPTNPVAVAGYTRLNEDHTPLTVDWFNGDLLAQEWYGSPPGTTDIGTFVEPDSGSGNYSGVRPVLHSPVGAARYIDWPNNTKVLNASRLTEGAPPGGDFITGTAQGNLVLTSPNASYDTGITPPPPPPPPTGVFWDINFGVTDPSVTPFGFDVVPNAPDPVAGTIIEVVSGTGSSNPVKQVGVGIRQTGFSTSSYATERTAGVTKPGLIGAVFNWSDWQPVSWNAYDNTALTGFDALVDFCKTETVAGRAVKIILRMIQPPLGGPNKTNTGNLPDWMVGVADSLNNSRPVPFWDKIDTDGGAHVARVATNWNADFTYNGNYVYHYQNAMQQMNGYLNGTTSTGNRRADFVHFVPVLGPTDTGSEMPIDMGSGSASFNPPVTVGGVVYGNDANGAPSIPDISIVNRRTAQLLMPASVVADTQTAQDTWLSNWWHNMSSVVLGGAGGLAQGNGSWMQCIAIHLAQSNFDSSVAYGSIMADGYARARDILTRNAAFLKTRLWTMQTNLRVRPPGGDYSRPISEWTYANWSANAAGHFLLAIQISSPGIPLIFMQTAASTGVGGSRGTPPSDFQRAVEDGITTYKAQGIETYTGVFTDATYGATNAAYANTANGIMQTTANQVATGGVTRGELHIKEVVAVTNGPIGRRNLPANTSDAWFRFVVDSITAPSATVTLHLSKSSGTTGDLAVRLDSTKHLIGRWSGGAVDWTDTNVLQSGDVVDIHHVLNGATSGYEIWVNGTQRRKNLALSAVAASVITYGQIGLANAADVEAWYYRYGAASTRMGTPTSGATNGDSPVVQIISPTDSQVFTSGGTKPVTVTAFDNDGLSAVEVRVDGGAWQAMTASGSQYTANVSLSGTAGQSLAHVIDVRATDAYSVVAQRLITIVSVTALVNVPGADTTLPTLTVTNPASNISVANAVDTQTVTGVATDNVAVTQCTVNSVAQTLDASGNFTTTIPLIVGANTITVQAKDAAGNTSTVTRTVTRQDVIVVSPPTVTITSPSAGQTFPKGTRALTLAGTASDPVALQSVTYNVDGSGEVSLTVSGGAFSSQIGITPGNHTITVTATNNASLRDTDTRNIFVALDDIVASGGETTGLQKGRVIVRA